MGWETSTIWWQLHPLGFLGAEGRRLPPGAASIPRLRQLEPWIDYAVALGCTGLALGPIFESETHGYDTVDHRRIDRRLGDDGDVDWLIHLAHDRGLRVLLDGVFNHVGRSFGPLADALARGAASPTARWFRPRRSSSWDDPGGVALRCFEGHRHLVTLDHRQPEVATYVSDVMLHWLDRGIDGWRLDAAYAVPLPFWREVTSRVRTHHPDAWLMGEVIHGDYVAFVTEGGLSSVTQYELWKAIWSALNDANLFELTWALERHDQLLDRFLPATFVGNHDVTRIASRLTDRRHLPHALAVLFTVGGVPSVYAGDEQGALGIKEDREGGDDAIRAPFPDRPDALDPAGWDVYRLHQDLIAVRRGHPWLAWARVEPCDLRDAALCYVAAADGDRVAVALSVAAEPVSLQLPEGAWSLACGAGDAAAGRVTLPAHGWAVLTTC